MAINAQLGDIEPSHSINGVLFTEAEIRERVDCLVVEMLHDCEVEDLVIVGILRGSFMFLADLVRTLYGHGVRPRIDFMTLSSYGSGTSPSGEVVLQKGLTVDVKGIAVLLVDDILDTGQTLKFATDHLKAEGVRSVKSCVLLDKPSRRETACQADYVGFAIDNEFVVGYGLDYDDCYRELPYIARVKFTK